MMDTHNAYDPRFTGDALGCPRKVARVKTKGTELEIASSYADSVDTLGTKFCVGRLATELEFPLFAIVSALSARC